MEKTNYVELKSVLKNRLLSEINTKLKNAKDWENISSTMFGSDSALIKFMSRLLDVLEKHEAQMNDVQVKLQSLSAAAAAPRTPGTN